MNILVTGAAGFIGFHLCQRLLKDNFTVIGLDNINSYYDVNLKNSRLNELNKKSFTENGQWLFYKKNLEDESSIKKIFHKYRPTIVINLAAQAGVRYSIENPKAYIDSNIVGFTNILECARHFQTKHLIYASSSSVYGGNKNLPFSENHEVNHPISLYAATKRSNELMAHTYSHLYNLPTTGLRFFTVYGPWGRPDMAYYIFTSKILKGESIKIFNGGKMYRDFTYIDDIIEGITSLIKKPPKKNPSLLGTNNSASTSWSPYKIFNIGNSSPINLMDFVQTIEEYLGIEAKKDFMPIQPGDVEATSANINLLKDWTGFKPRTNLKNGVRKFIEWYLEYYNLEKTIDRV